MSDTPARAKAVVAWAIVGRDGTLTTICFPFEPTNRSLHYHGERVARVEIREIEESDDAKE